MAGFKTRTGVGYSRTGYYLPMCIVFATACSYIDLTYRLYFLKIYSNLLIEVPGDEFMKLSIMSHFGI